MFKGKSVEVVLRGGLGNQMFQYAIGRSLSIRLGLSLLIDSSRLRVDVPVARSYDLGCFRLSGHRTRSRPSLVFRAGDKLQRTMNSYCRGSPYLIKERTLQFEPEVLKVDGPCRLEGYWQSERYFESISDQLRSEFAILPAPDARSAECADRMQRVNSVGLHIRRGDYVTHADCSAFHGTCPAEYYDAALRFFQSRFGPKVELFVFSDDMKWTRENIRFPVATTYVDWNADRNYEDLRLMSSCSALAIANSAFSWWAGWINPDPEKLVVAPKRWFRAPGVFSDLPESPWLIAL